MCGINAYIGDQSVVPILLDGLRRLEYRGYDSTGIAMLMPSDQDKGYSLEIIRAKGKLSMLEEKLSSQAHSHQLGQNMFRSCTIGIGHTRWATHGRPSDENAHPHQYGTVAVVHNGIIENYLLLRSLLMKEGHVFQSETDTEIIAHLVERELQKQGKKDLLLATQKALQQVHGAYAIVVISSLCPEEVICAKNSSPLIVGLGQGENFLASDLPALLPNTRKVIFLEEGDLVRMTKNQVEIYNLSLQKQQRPVKEITWSLMVAEKEGYKHFMLKEIHEQVRAVADTLRGRVQHDPPDALLDGYTENLTELERLYFLACGTSFHAGKLGEYWVEKLAKIPAKAELASEFRYREPFFTKYDKIVAISQSGETLDTLEAIREARRQGASIFSIVNVFGSSIPRASDVTLYTHAGLEIGVASTKAFITQLVALLLFAIHLGVRSGALSIKMASSLLEELTALPHKIAEVLQQADAVQKLARPLSQAKDILFLGRGLQFPIALEGALKLKELSYIHAEGYAGGELKHGPIALIEEGLPVVVLAPQDEIYEKMLANISEVKARGAFVIAIATEGDQQIQSIADEVIFVPKTLPDLYPLLTVIPLQLLAYYVADAKGNDVDQPRNLAKSVTVE